MTKKSSLRARNSSIQAAMAAATGSDRPAKKNAPQGKEAASDEKLIGLSVRLKPETHEQLRKIAFDRRVSIHSLFLEGIDFVVRKHSQ